MFKVRNGTGGSLPLQLEKGSIILNPGQSYDVDGICSRKWIKEDPVFNYLVNTGNLTVLHDSEKVIGKHELKAHPRIRKLPKAKKIDEPIVIDFDEEPLEEEEEIKPKVVEKVKPKKKTKTKEKKAAAAKKKAVKSKKTKKEEVDPIEAAIADFGPMTFIGDSEKE